MNKTIHCKTCAGAFDSINVKADTFCKCKYCGVENYIDAKYNTFLDKPKKNVDINLKHIGIACGAILFTRYFLMRKR